MKSVRMIGGVSYEKIDRHGLTISRQNSGEDPELIEADTVVLCAGQESERILAEQLIADGQIVHVIGGADLASELDAKRAIDQGVRLASTL